MIRWLTTKAHGCIRNVLGRKNPFNPMRYWENRHERLFGSIRAVADIRLSEDENQRDYEENWRQLKDVILGTIGTSPVGKRLLDAGCGVGKVSLECQRLGFDIIGFDFSEIAIEQAQQRCEGRFHCAQLHEILVEDSVDIVICLDVLFHVVDDNLWESSLAALVNAIEPGSHIIILEFFPGKASSNEHIRWRSLAAYRDALARLDCSIEDTKQYLQPCAKKEKSLLLIRRNSIGASGIC